MSGPAEVVDPTTGTTDRAPFLVATATVLAVGSFVLPLGVRWILTPVVFLLPGHALVCASFGHRLEFGGVRRVCLAAMLSLATLPILALAVFSLGIRMTHASVAISTWSFVGGCAVVVAVRARRVAAGTVVDDVAPPGSRPRIDLRQLVVPVAAMAAALLIAWSSLHLLPRQDPVPFSVAAFAGPWALVDGAVGYDAGQEPAVDVSVANRTPQPVRYTVEPRVVADDGSVSDWPATTIKLGSGDSRDLTVAGLVPDGQCRAKLEVRVTPSAGDPLDPLTAYLRDRNAGCTPSAAGT